jgi:hypothetical protein
MKGTTEAPQEYAMMRQQQTESSSVDTTAFGSQSWTFAMLPGRYRWTPFRSCITSQAWDEQDL